MTSPEDIKNIKLTQEELLDASRKIKSLIERHRIMKKQKIKYFEILMNLYKAIYKTNYSMSDIYSFIDRDRRTIQRWIKELGFVQTLSEVGKRSNRNYNKIHSHTMETIIKHRLSGTNPEQYIREMINVELSKIFKETIVGIHNNTILSNNREIDIPIVIFYSNKCYKIALEINGTYWHEKAKEKDKLKEKDLIDKGFLFYSIYIKANTYHKQLNKLIKQTINKINNDIKGVHNKLY